MCLSQLPLAVLTLATAAFAQCGSNQITTPPNYAGGSGFGVGSFMYFQLDVSPANGVSICGLDLHTNISGQIGGVLYLHNSISDWTLLNAANTTSADWSVVACLQGTGSGSGSPSAMTIVNGTGSLDLPTGSYVVAIGGGSFDHASTIGNGGNQIGGDPNLTFKGGMSVTAFGMVPASPRVFNGGFDYDVPGAPVTLSPGGVNCVPSTCTISGSGCGGAASPTQFFEEFGGGNPWDLNDPSVPMADQLVIVGNAGTIDTFTIPAPPVIAPVSPALLLGDDENSALVPLGFDLSAFGLPCVDSISISSNGYIWLGATGPADFSESVGELYAESARLAVLWDNFKPAAGGGGGTVHVDFTFSGAVIVTWWNVEYWTVSGGGPVVSFQAIIEPTAIRYLYCSTDTFNDDGIVGFSNGFAQPIGAASDLDGGPLGPFLSGGRGDLTLDCVQRPVLGGSLDMQIRNVLPGGIGAMYVKFGIANAGIPLTGPTFEPNCFNQMGLGLRVLGLVVNGNPCLSYAFSLNVPLGFPGFLNIPFGCQAAALDPIAGKVSTSNGLTARIGNF